jgi:quinol monooxygenase YgiN
MEIFVFARLHARPGKQTEVREAMFEIHGPTRLEPVCLSYGAFRSVRDPDEFYIHTRWKDMAAFEDHACRYLASICRASARPAGYLSR